MEATPKMIESLDDYYRSGRFSTIVEERRAVLPTAARLFMLRPPPGSYPKPPTPDFNLVLTLDTPHRVSLDLGAGRWRRLSVSGDMGLQPANSAADIVVDDPHHLLIVSMPEIIVFQRLEELGLAIPDFGALHSASFRDPLVEQLCLRMWMESQEGDALGALFLDTAVAMLITLLATLARNARSRMGNRSGFSPPQLRRVIDHIQANLTEDLRLDELAATSGLSASHFVRTFRVETGMSPHQYVLRARVERAKDMLVRTRLPVGDVAALTGFSSTGHLGTWFRRLVGVRPLEYRRLN